MTNHDLGVVGVSDPVQIGQGGYGVVYRCTETDLDRPVAVKVLSGQLDELGRNRFERERRAMGTLSGHPNIVTVHRSGITDSGRPFLVMEYLAGGSRADVLRREGPLAWPQVLDLAVEICGALETAHREGVLHRDIKPANLLVSNLGVTKLGDFGIARMQGAPETQSAMITASIAHAAPEIIDGHRPDALADVYSLGSTLFELLAGAPAFLSATDESLIPVIGRIARNPVPDLRHSGIPDQVCRALEAAMAKAAAHRLQSAEALGRQLQTAQRSLGQAVTPMRVEGEGIQAGPTAPSPAPAATAQTLDPRPPPPTTGPQTSTGVPRSTLPPGPARPVTPNPAVPLRPTPAPQPRTAAGAQLSPVATTPGMATPAQAAGAVRHLTPPPQAAPQFAQPQVASFRAPSPMPVAAPPLPTGPRWGRRLLWATLLLALIGVVTVVLAAIAADRDTSATSAGGDDDQTTRVTVEPDRDSAVGDDSVSGIVPESSVPTGDGDDAVDGAGGIEFSGNYEDYVRYFDGTGIVSVELPLEWDDITVIDHAITASSDLSGYQGSYATSGFGVILTETPLALDPSIALVAANEVGCQDETDPFAVTAGAYTGASKRFTECGPGDLTEVIQTVLVAPGGNWAAIVSIQLTDPRDQAAVDHIYATLELPS